MSQLQQKQSKKQRMPLTMDSNEGAAEWLMNQECRDLSADTDTRKKRLYLPKKINWPMYSLCPTGRFYVVSNNKQFFFSSCIWNTKRYLDVGFLG